MLLALAGLLPVSIASAQVAGAPAAQVDYSQATVAAGNWSYRAIAGGSESNFMDAGATVRLSIRCTRASRQVTISRANPAAASTMFVWTSSAQRTLPARFEQAALRVSADLPANDPLLDAIAFSSGRFAISLAGAVAMVVPTAPEPARVFEDCRI